MSAKYLHEKLGKREANLHSDLEVNEDLVMV